METVRNTFQTSQEWAQCRNEEPFPVVIKVIAGQVAIDCPHCGRRYTPRPRKETWFSDRELMFLSLDEVSSLKL